MGVYIKGMEMPTSCLECRLYNDPWCMAKNRNQWRTAYNRPPKGERQNDCPLVPVPPHGRLIDADAFKKYIAVSFEEVAPELEGGYKWLAERITNDLLKDIDDAPTVIPAEEVET